MIINGKNIAEEIIARLKKRTRPKKSIVAVVVDESPATESFIKQKLKVASYLGIPFHIKKFKPDISQKTLLKKVKSICEDKKIGGVIIQLPLPKHIDSQKILDILPVQKDIDVLSSNALGKFCFSQSKILPPVVGAISEIIKKYKIKLWGRNVLVIGSGKLVGFPVAIWLIQKGAETTVINEAVKNISYFSKNSDIIICGAGKAGLLRSNMVKDGVIIFDAGYSVLNGKIKGDVEVDEKLLKKAKILTPVPGGIGPITVALLFRNFYILNQK
jgi:methylenetetrahydrofolate dehydrogenase (NADP+)/methenyltetrahydrofolate cyclohydrolase